MKRYISIMLLVAAVFATSCVSEEDLLFEKSAAERLNEASATYSKSLLASPHGWALEYYPHGSTDEDSPYTGSGFLLLTQFKPDMSVKVGMNNFMSYNNYQEDTSAWEVITDNGPVLSFNTFNTCLHAFSNPEDLYVTTGTYEDETGKGMLGDYEFVMVDVPKDGNYILLKGKKRGAYSRLTPLDEETDFNEYLTDTKDFQTKNFPTTAPNYNVITVGDKRYKMIMAQNGGALGIVKMWPFESDSIFTKELVPMLITRHGVKDSYTYNLRFRRALKDNGEQAEQEFVYNAEEQKFYGVNDAANTIEGANPTDHFVMALETGHRWSVSSRAASAKFADALAAVVSQAAALNYTYKSTVFTSFADGLTNVEMTFTTVRRVNGRNQTVTATANYVFEAKYEGGELTIKYKEPADDAAATVIGSITGLTDFFAALNGTYVATAVDNPLVLSKVNVAKKDDSDFGFEASYVK